MGCNGSTGTVHPVNSHITTKITSPIHPQHSQGSIMKKEIDHQRVQPQDLIQNFLLIWLDSNLDESNQDFCNSLTKLRRTVDTIETFRDVDECLKYISQ